MAENKGITTLACKKCGETISGPDKKDVTETMERHHKKTGHK